MHYVAERMHSITGKRALKHRAVCTKLSVFTFTTKLYEDIGKQCTEVKNEVKLEAQKVTTI